MMLGRFLLLLLALCLPTLSWAEGRTFTYDGSRAEAGLPAGTLIAAERIKIPGIFKGKAWRMLYATRDYRGSPILSSGITVLPDHAAKNPAQRSIVAWAHPTMGIARKCAPSLGASPIHSILGLNDLVASGHIIAATDYPGLGTPGPVGYMVGKGQANAVIDSVRAARQIPGVGGGRDFALWGYSQGAHAALYAALFASSYAPELRLVGTAAVAPPTQLGALLESDIGRLEGRVLASYVIGSWTRKYGLSTESLVDPRALPAIAAITRRCVNNLEDEMAILSLQKPLASTFLLQSPTAIPNWRRAITTNSISAFSAATPAIIFQGNADTIVAPGLTARVVGNSCRNGSRIQYVSVPGAGHGKAAKASVTQAVNWIDDRFRGRPAPSNCR